MQFFENYDCSDDFRRIALLKNNENIMKHMQLLIRPPVLKYFKVFQLF